MNDSIMIPKDYHLCWSDEFDGDSASFVHWNTEAREVGRHNHELQEYVQSDENVFVKDGYLHIRPVKMMDDDGNITFSSGHITTQGKHEYTYGRFEARMKLPSGAGFIPFFKLRCDDNIYGKWPLGGQIDIMAIPTHTPTKQYATVHYGEKIVSEQGAYPFPQGTDACSEFHIYGCEWMPGRISFFVDGIEFFAANVNEPFNHPFFITLGLGIGGDLAGKVAEITSFEDDNDFLIDYVRVFQKDEYTDVVPGRKRRTIAVCGNWEDAENYNTFLRAIQIPEIQQNYVVASFTFGFMYEHLIEDELRMANFVAQANPMAIIIFVEMIKEEAILERLVEVGKSLDIPVFTLEKPYPGTIFLQLDFDGGFENICRHIIEHHGCRNVEMFAGFRGNEFSNRRIEIFKNVLRDNQIDFDERMVHYGDFWDAAASQVLDALIKSGYKVPEAIICANDSMAIGIMETLEQHGYRVPNDVMVSGIDGIREGKIHNPTLTTCMPEYATIALTIEEIIADWKNSSNRDHYYDSPILINYRNEVNESCGCKKAGNNETWSKIVSEYSRDNSDCFRHMIEMGKFVNSSLKSINLIEAMSALRSHLWMWKDQYYFIGLIGKDEKFRVLFSYYKNEYKNDLRYKNLNVILPDLDTLLDENSGINILLFKQIHIQNNDFVFTASGLRNLSLRSQQRFEEFAMFVASVVNSVYNNQKYLRANKEIERMSEMDYLTGLYNRRGFFREIHKRMLKNTGTPFSISLFSIDMDGLKYINDNFGHSDGDQAIQAMANAILRYTAGKGICARYGGDEFAFALISGDTESVDIDFVRDSIDTILQNYNLTSHKPYDVAASIGYSFRIADADFSLDDMLKEADAMMYEEKQRRKAIKNKAEKL